MSTRFVTVDRLTPLLLPPDLRDWVANDDLAHFILEAVEGLDLSVAQVNARGTGSAQYPPGMMLGVLMYCYATSRFSSRQIERATWRDVSVRFLTGDTHPDHDTIAAFRRQNRALIERAFVEVLLLAQRLGLCRMGVISVDGTKLKAAAAKRQTRTYQEIEAELAAVTAQVQGLLQTAEQAETTDEGDGTQLPEGLRRKEARRAQLEQARAELAAQKAQRAQAREQARKDRDPDDVGRPPRPLSPEPSAKDRINLTDADSQLMPTRKEGFVQGYNAQLAVTAQAEGGLVVGAHVCNEPHDREQLVASVQAIVPGLDKSQVILADRGYDNHQQIRAVERQTGAEVLCPPQGLPHTPKEEKRPVRKRLREAREQRRQRMAEPQMRGLYGLREITVEPVIGIIKEAMGFRRFHLRGLAKVNVEWQLVCLAFNCRRLAPRWARA